MKKKYKRQIVETFLNDEIAVKVIIKLRSRIEILGTRQTAILEGSIMTKHGNLHTQ